MISFYGGNGNFIYSNINNNYCLNNGIIYLYYSNYYIENCIFSNNSIKLFNLINSNLIIFNLNIYHLNLLGNINTLNITFHLNKINLYNFNYLNTKYCEKINLNTKNLLKFLKIYILFNIIII